VESKIAWSVEARSVHKRRSKGCVQFGLVGRVSFRWERLEVRQGLLEVRLCWMEVGVNKVVVVEVTTKRVTELNGELRDMKIKEPLIRAICGRTGPQGERELS
jgi:hypothetical protein